MDEQYLTVREVASLLRINIVTVHRWIKSGKLQATKFGRDWRIPAAEVRRITEG